MQGGNMNFKLQADHGRSKALETMKKALEENHVNRSAQENKHQKRIKNRKDTFEKTQIPAEKTEGSDNKEKSLDVSFQFDLFYQLSTKVEAKMGKSGLNRFTEVSSTVAETFAGNFNLKIDAVGSFFKNTDDSLEVSAETANEFFDAVEGLADLSPEALENFLAKTENFFNELKETYQDESGVFDGIKEQVKAQASEFFSQVDSARTQAMEFESQDALPGAATADVAIAPDQVETEAQADNNLIQMAFKPEISVNQDQYKDFLQKFLDYSEKFRQQMLENFFGRNSSNKSEKTSLDPFLKTEGRANANLKS
jgi:hypothetical protein